jgi:hypothetical protein
VLFASGPHSPDDQEELQEISNNGSEMVSSLLSVFPHAAAARDMDGQLPVDCGIRNKSSAMCGIVTGLLDVHSDCLRVEGGEAALLADFELAAQEPALKELIQCILRHWPDSEGEPQDMTPAWPQAQLELLRTHNEYHSAAGGVGPCVLQRFIRRLQHCAVPNEQMPGETITEVLADSQMQALFRVLAYEFFMRTRICEYTYTTAAGTAIIAQMEREATAAAAKQTEDIRAAAVLTKLGGLKKPKALAPVEDAGSGAAGGNTLPFPLTLLSSPTPCSLSLLRDSRVSPTLFLCALPCVCVCVCVCVVFR